MFVLKRVFVFVMAFFFSFQTIFVEHVFAATQRKTTSTARSGSSRTSSAKKNTTARKATSSRTSRASKTTARSGSSARKTTTRSSTARSSTRNSGATTALRSSQTADISTNTNDATANARGTACRNAYVECMDIQIEGLLTKYSYLADDDAIIAMQETGDPLRCIYYHDLNTSTTTKTSSSSIKNINDLYYAYNYYCEQETEAGASGQPIIKCNFVGFDNLTNVYATNNSTAFYKEVYDRLMADELKIINFD